MSNARANGVIAEGHPWPKQPLFAKRDRLTWYCNSDCVRRDGVVTDINFVEESVPAWVIDCLPRFLWRVFARQEQVVSYVLHATDGHQYDIHEPMLNQVPQWRRDNLESMT